MKLELKHLAPYMPYGLKYVKYSDNNSPIRHDIMQGVSTNGIYACGDITPLSFKNCKPILRPFSDLTKEELLRFTVNFRMYYQRKDFAYEMMLVSDFNIANELHLDYRRLIEKGLAIDINTLEN